MTAGLVSTAHLLLRFAQRIIRALTDGRKRRTRAIGLGLVTCIVPTAAMISVPTTASVQTTITTVATVKVTSPTDGSCAVTSARNLQASFTGTGTVSYMSYFLNGAWEKQIDGPTAPWNWTGNYANGTYTTVAKAT
jgi:hypothetical protein